MQPRVCLFGITFLEVNMITYEQVSAMLSDIMDDVPPELFEGLTGGVILSENVKLHPDSKPYKPLYIMGEYRRDMLGRSIVIYYGSFNVVYGASDLDTFKKKLKHTFSHELRHHLEMLSGVKDLEKYDAQKLGMYNSGIDIAGFNEPPI